MKTQNSNSRWNLFSEAIRDGRTDEARKLMQALADRYPTNPKVWHWLLRLAETIDQRMIYHRKLVQLEPQNRDNRHHFIRLLFNQGVASAKTGDHERARDLFKEACILHPGSEKIWYWRAFVAPDNETRARYLRKVLKINPDHQQANAWFSTRSQATIRQEASWQCPICQEHYSEAQTECKQCGVYLDLDNIDYMLGERQIDQNLIQIGITNLAHRALNGHRFQNRLNIGIAHLNLHQWEKALEVFLDIHTMAPDHSLLNKAIHHLQAKAEQGIAAKQPPSRSRGTVMIVDDSTTVRKLVSITVEDLGFKVLEASNGSQALSKIFEQKPNIIFLDIKMPQMDGYQVCRILKENQHTADIPVIMLTGQDGFFDRVRGKMVGALDYITKPFEAETLVAALEKHVFERIRHGH